MIPAHRPDMPKSYYRSDSGRTGRDVTCFASLHYVLFSIIIDTFDLPLSLR